MTFCAAFVHFTSDTFNDTKLEKIKVVLQPIGELQKREKKNLYIQIPVCESRLSSSEGISSQPVRAHCNTHPLTPSPNHSSIVSLTPLSSTLSLLERLSFIQSRLSPSHVLAEISFHLVPSSSHTLTLRLSSSTHYFIPHPHPHPATFSLSHDFNPLSPDGHFCQPGCRNK